MSLSVQNGPDGVVFDLAAAGADAEGFAAHLDTAVAELPSADSAVRLWVHEVSPELHAVATKAGFVAYRDLWQMRCRLPQTRSELVTRGYEPGDADALIRVNNRAFSWHPEQSGLDRDRLAATMSEPWFDAAGVRILERGDQMAGFCWTKVHADMDPAMGEIFVICIDPEFHGQGLGVPMTLAGLDWLADHGLTRAMLYVESDNHAAVATYERIGFGHAHTDRAYELSENHRGR